MNWQQVTVGDFLKNRPERFKPHDKRNQGLKRIDKIDFSGHLFLSNKPSNTDMILVKKDDLVISGINVEKGAMCIYEDEEDISATIHYSSYLIDRDRIDINFLKLFLVSPEFKDGIKEQVPGGIKTEIKPKHLLPLKIVIPKSLEEQSELVRKYSKSKERISNLSSEIGNQLRLISKLRLQILQDAIQGKLVSQDPNDEPASVLLEKIRAEKEKLVKEKKLKKSKPLPPIKEEEIPFDIPENWLWCRFGEVINEINTGFSSSAHNQEGKGFAHLRPMNIDTEGKINLDVVKYIPNSKCTPLKKNDIFFNNTNSNVLVGKTALIQEDTNWIYSNHMTKIKLFMSEHLANFITLYFNYLFKIGYFKKLCRQYINQASISLTFLKYELLVPLPPILEQQRIISWVEESSKKCDELGKEVKQNQNLTQQLLQSALKEALEPKVN